MGRRPWLPAGRVRATGALALLVLAATGCGATRVVGDVAGPVVTVNERDFKITASPRKIAAGNVHFRAQNHGPDAHELIVVRAASGRLPMRSDGLTVDEDALEKATVGVLEPGEPGSVRDLQVRLAPGRYLLICNMSGHFMGGMETALVVK
jgi:uncharacterized cupredoxin-like copper-binding protein